MYLMFQPSAWTNVLTVPSFATESKVFSTSDHLIYHLSKVMEILGRKITLSSWASYLACLNLNFSICKVGAIAPNLVVV